MYFNDKATFLGGLAMVLLAACTIIIVVMAVTSTGDQDPFEREDTPKFLTEVHDNEAQVLAGTGVGILSDGVLAFVAAVSIFVLFRDRSFALATAAMAGLLATATLSLVNDGLNLLLTIIAEDYVKGGAAGVAAGDPAILELGRFIGMANMVLFNVINTTFGVGMVAIGVLLARSPQGAINPPRWLGWVAVFSGVSSWLTWSVVIAEPFFIFFPLGGISSLIVFFGLGGWLLAHRSAQPQVMAASPSMA